LNEHAVIHLNRNALPVITGSLGRDSAVLDEFALMPRSKLNAFWQICPSYARGRLDHHAQYFNDPKHVDIGRLSGQRFTAAGPHLKFSLFLFMHDDR
jgi:hypothetical protein